FGAGGWLRGARSARARPWFSECRSARGRLCLHWCGRSRRMGRRVLVRGQAGAIWCGGAAVFSDAVLQMVPSGFFRRMPLTRVPCRDPLRPWAWEGWSGGDGGGGVVGELVQGDAEDVGQGGDGEEGRG